MKTIAIEKYLFHCVIVDQYHLFLIENELISIVKLN